MSWSTAHRVAHIAAVQALHELKVPHGEFPVYVEAAIDRAGVPLLWRPMDQLFGTYLRVGEVRGILVNERLTRSGRRHTAAHELGHHRFGHRLDPGVPCAVDTGEEQSPPRRWTPDEKAAEAFADWFLMPPKAVRAALDCLGLERPDGPGSVYQLSLLLGTTYRATARHCLSLRLASSADRQAWSKVSPGTLKQRLVARPLPSTREVDVWSVQPPQTSKYTARHLSPGDLVVLAATVLHDAGDLPVTDNGPDQVMITAPAVGNHTLKVAGARSNIVDLQLIVHPRPHGLQVPEESNPSPGNREVTA